MVIAGIDYSITGPCICVFSGTKFSYRNCKFFFLTDTKKYQKPFINDIVGASLPENYQNDTERFDIISDHFMNVIQTEGVNHILLESYAFGGSGKVFNIAENTGILKHKLLKSKIKFDIVPPTVIKKFASGKGNADKAKMYECFVKETQLDLLQELEYTKKDINSPISDIADSYFLVKYLFERIEDAQRSSGK